MGSRQQQAVGSREAEVEGGGGGAAQAIVAAVIVVASRCGSAGWCRRSRRNGDKSKTTKTFHKPAS